MDIDSLNPLSFSEWPEGVIFFDENRRITRISDSACALLHGNKNDYLGISIHKALCPKSSVLVHSEENCPFAVQSMDSYKAFSGYWETHQGDYLGVDYRLTQLKLEGEPHFFVAFQPNENQEFCQAELEKFSVFVASSPSAMTEFDPYGQSLFSNPAMQALLLEHDFNEAGEARILPENLSELCGQIADAQEGIHNIEVQVGDFWFSWNLMPIKQHAMTTVIGYVFDISEAKMTASRLEQEKAESRREFFAKMVHELRSPLNAINGFSQILLKRLADSITDRDKKHLKSIRTAGLQLSELISDTLDISKIEAGKMDVDIETFHIGDVFNSIYEQMKNLAEAKSLDYKVQCPERIKVSSDSKKIRQIAVNLISNGIKYTRQGSVEVDVEELQVDGARWLKIQVSDSGIGIPEGQLDQLFKEYHQVSEKQNRHIQGTGLGLALVGELVSLLQGSIHVQSEYGEGSCFTVKVPVDLASSNG